VYLHCIPALHYLRTCISIHPAKPVTVRSGSGSNVVCCFVIQLLFHHLKLVLIIVLWNLGLGFGLDAELHYFSIFHGE